jgi:hypothetical protein
MANKYFITQQANGAYSIYTDAGEDSMADEKLVAYDLVSNEAAENYVTNDLNGEFSYDV